MAAPVSFSRWLAPIRRLRKSWWLRLVARPPLANLFVIVGPVDHRDRRAEKRGAELVHGKLAGAAAHDTPALSGAGRARTELLSDAFPLASPTHFLSLTFVTKFPPRPRRCQRLLGPSVEVPPGGCHRCCSVRLTNKLSRRAGLR